MRSLEYTLSQAAVFHVIDHEHPTGRDETEALRESRSRRLSFLANAKGQAITILALIDAAKEDQ